MIVKGDEEIVSRVNSILLIQLADIGDAVLSFSSVRALRERYPQSKIMVAVREKSAELIALCPWADGVIPVVEKKRSAWRELVFQWGFFRRLRRYNFDLVVDLRTGTRGAILAFLSGARERVGFYSTDGRPWRDLVYSKIFRPALQPGLHMSRYLLDLLAAYGVATDHPQPEFIVPLAMQEQVDELLRQANVPTNKPLVAVQPFSLWRYKELSTEKYVQLIGWIREKYQLPVLVVGGPGEEERVQAIVEGCGQDGVYNFVGQTSIGLYGALLHRCRLFIGVDSAGQHLAAAAGVATVVIYGPSCPLTWAPQGERHLVVQNNDLDCVPCYQAGCDGNRLRSRCLDELPVAELIPFVDRQLGSLGAESDEKTVACR